jgi:hypothetical protein
MSGVSLGAAAVASVVKWGEDAFVTDESIKRQGFNPVQRALTKLINQTVKTIDALTLSADRLRHHPEPGRVRHHGRLPGRLLGQHGHGADDPAGHPAGQGEDRGPEPGLRPGHLRLRRHHVRHPHVRPDRDQRAAPGDPDSPVYSGNLPEIGNLRVLPTSNMPSGNRDAWVLDSQMLGGMADENLGGPGYSGAVQGVETKSMREDETDRWRLRARRVTVPVIQEPNAICKITNAIGT